MFPLFTQWICSRNSVFTGRTMVFLHLFSLKLSRIKNESKWDHIVFITTLWIHDETLPCDLHDRKIVYYFLHEKKKKLGKILLPRPFLSCLVDKWKTHDSATIEASWLLWNCFCVCVFKKKLVVVKICVCHLRSR